MKNLRWIVPALAIALAAPGCVLVSGQFLIDFDLDEFTTTTESTVTHADVDLTTEEDYNDHKDELKGLSDVAGCIRSITSRCTKRLAKRTTATVV